MEKTIAFFDFDGTITRKDSMIAFIKFCKGKKEFFKGLVYLSPWLVGMKTGMISNSDAKEKMLSFFFKGTDLAVFNSWCKGFAETGLPQLVRADAVNAIIDHQDQGHEVVVVSASAENWISPWCNKMNIKYIGTKLLTDNENRITGKISGANCNGREKVNRIIQSYDPALYNNIYAYGDSNGDKLMLKLATHPYYRHFKD